MDERARIAGKGKSVVSREGRQQQRPESLRLPPLAAVLSGALPSRHEFYGTPQRGRAGVGCESPPLNLERFPRPPCHPQTPQPDWPRSGIAETTVTTLGDPRTRMSWPLGFGSPFPARACDVAPPCGASYLEYNGHLGEVTLTCGDQRPATDINLDSGRSQRPMQCQRTRVVDSLASFVSSPLPVDTTYIPAARPGSSYDPYSAVSSPGSYTQATWSSKPTVAQSSPPSSFTGASPRSEKDPQAMGGDASCVASCMHSAASCVASSLPRLVSLHEPDQGAGDVREKASTDRSEEQRRPAASYFASYMGPAIPHPVSRHTHDVPAQANGMRKNPGTLQAPRQRPLLRERPRPIRPPGLNPLPKCTLRMRQRPVAARACRVGESDLCTVDPFPIVQFEVDDGPGVSHTAQWRLSMWPSSCLFVKLLDEGGQKECDLLPPEEGAGSTGVGPISLNRRLLWGDQTSGPFTGLDELDVPGKFFCFPNLMVQAPGTYRLHFALCLLYPAPSTRAGDFAPIVATLMSDPFRVFAAKDFPGMRPSSALAITLKKQGCNQISLKKSKSRPRSARGTGRNKKRRGSSGEIIKSEEDEDLDY